MPEGGVTPAVLDRPGSVTDRPALGGGGTLEELLAATLHAARANGSAECPVCRARMTATRAGAECGGCGSRLR
jgi:hypothetical protein